MRFSIASSPDQPDVYRFCAVVAFCDTSIYATRPASCGGSVPCHALSDNRRESETSCPGDTRPQRPAQQLWARRTPREPMATGYGRHDQAMLRKALTPERTDGTAPV